VGLSGTLDTFSLVEILGLVERARQTGALEIRGPEGSGTLYVTAGRFCAGEAADWSGPVEGRAALEVRIVDVCFHLFRLSAGSFEFVPDHTPPWTADRATDIGPVVERVEALVRAWPTIQSLVPSLDTALEVCQHITDDSLLLSRDGFRLITLVDSRLTIRQLARKLERSEVEVAAIAAELMQEGALRPAMAGATPSPSPSGVVLPTGALHAVRAAPEGKGADEVVTSVPDPNAALDRQAIERERAALAARAGLSDPGPVPDPDAQDADGDADEESSVISTDRGAILRMFSGLRDQG